VDNFSPLLGWIVIDMIEAKCPDQIAVGFFQIVADVCLRRHEIPTAALAIPAVNKPWSANRVTVRRSADDGGRRVAGTSCRQAMQDQLTVRCSWCGNRDRGRHLTHRGALPPARLKTMTPKRPIVLYLRALIATTSAAGFAASPAAMRAPT
jgi:hypothetical protein